MTIESKQKSDLLIPIAMGVIIFMFALWFTGVAHGVCDDKNANIEHCKSMLPFMDLLPMIMPTGTFLVVYKIFNGRWFWQ